MGDFILSKEGDSNGGKMPELDGEFAELVHLSIVVNKDERRNLKNVAQALGVSYDNLYSRLRSDKPSKFTAGQIRSLIKATEDIRLIDFFLEGTPFIAANKPSPGNEPMTDETLRQSAGRPAIEVGDIIREVEKALSDGRLCHQDKMRINREIDEAERALSALRAYLL